LKPSDLGRLVLLGAIWGFSFIFLRICSPVLGAVATTTCRVLVASLVLGAIVLFQKVPLDAKNSWKNYLILGILNSAFPFCLISWAETRISASTAAILNATTPIFAMIAAAIWLGENVEFIRLLGAIVALGGVALVVGGGSGTHFPQDLLPIGASLVAALSYGTAATYSKANTTKAPPLANALGSQASATLLLAPLAFMTLPTHLPTQTVVLSVLALGIFCTGFAYVLFFRLIADIGPAKAVTVTFLAPLFGMIWAFLFLGEEISSVKIIGSATILAGTYLTTRTTKPAKSERTKVQG
jgi:drug/metabolite transporter (DMT)-like permease